MITLFQDADFRGRRKDFKIGSYSYIGNDFNDLATSIQISSGSRLVVEVFEHPNFQGRSTVISYSQASIGADWSDGNFKVSHLNDAVSSLIVRQRRSNEVILYQHSNFQGLAHSDVAGQKNQVRFNDDYSSIDLPDGYGIEVFEDTNLRGRSQIFYGDVSFAGSLNDKISSYRTFQLSSTYRIQRLDSDGIEGHRHTFKIVREQNEGSALPGQVRFTSSNYSALAREDYHPYSVIKNFAAGQLEATVYIDSIRDSKQEGTERFNASISKVNSLDTITTASTWGWIFNGPLSYEGRDKDGISFKMLFAGGAVTISDPSWSVRFQVKNGHIDPSLPTYVYTHGWKDSPSSDNSRLIYTALSRENANVIFVDWTAMAAMENSSYATDTPFQPSTAVTVTKQVGETVADFLLKSGISPLSTTLIGHSLGSFVSASAALDIRARSGKKVNELVALDNAFGINYDIDARNRVIDKPLEFTNDVASRTSSYTASDLVRFVTDWAGDNDRAATAQNAYIVQYARSNNLPDSKANNALAFHNGVVGVYADLFTKKSLHPRIQNKFDATGKPSTNGKFDGVIVAAMPWAYQGGNAVIKSPKAIGWTDLYNDPTIYGTSTNDIMFFDRFADNNNGISLKGLAGDDWLVADQTDGRGLDMLTGGLGIDEFWLGYERYGQRRAAYTSSHKSPSVPDNSYALITDFKSNEDYIRLPYNKSAYSFVQGTELGKNFYYKDISKVHGDGTGILSQGDLVAYISGLSSSLVSGLLDKRITFGIYAPLDSRLFM